MKLNVLAISSFALAFSCVGPTDTDEQPPDPVRISAQMVELDPAIADEGDICSLLPSCGPCSLACDPEKLAQEYVPEGACALFACTLTDGRTIEVDACNYGDACTARPAPPGNDGFAHPTCASVEVHVAR